MCAGRGKMYDSSPSAEKDGFFYIYKQCHCKALGLNLTQGRYVSFHTKAGSMNCKLHRSGFLLVLCQYVSPEPFVL